MYRSCNGHCENNPYDTRFRAHILPTIDHDYLDLVLPCHGPSP